MPVKDIPSSSKLVAQLYDLYIDHWLFVLIISVSVTYQQRGWYSNVLFLLHLLLLLASERYASFLPLCLLLQAAVFLRAHNSHVLWWPSGRVIINIQIAADESGLFAVITRSLLGETSNEWRQQ